VQLQQFSAQIQSLPTGQPQFPPVVAPAFGGSSFGAPAFNAPPPPAFAPIGPLVTQTGQTARLYVVCQKSVPQEMFARLFSQYPGLLYADLKRDRSTGESKGFGFVGFSNVGSASAAQRELDGAEFPRGSGHMLKVVFAEPPRNKDGTNSGAGGGAADGGEPQSSPPQQQPELAPGTDASRLFAVMTRPVPSEDVLWEVFNQFPGLQYVRVLPGKNFGYVKYGTSAAASHALYYLDGAEVVNGSKITVKIADPPPTESHGGNDSRKRQRP